MIYAKKGTNTTIFTEFIWKNMGANKNGWRQITKEQFDGKAPIGKGQTPDSLANETEYRALMDQAKGFKKDGNLSDALAKYEAASALKRSPRLTGVINELKKQIEAEKAAEASAEMILQRAQAAESDGELALALDIYEDLNAEYPSDETGKKIKALKARIDAALEA